MTGTNLCGSTADEIYNLIKPLGFTQSHAVSVAVSVYRKRIADIFQFQKIPKRLMEELYKTTYSGIFSPAESIRSEDGSIKYLFRNGEGMVYETVYIPEGKRKTVCVSTQSGCRMGCPFCATGKFGFHGNLSAGEIVNQVISLPDVPDPTHVVFMGMGEPLDNTDNVLKACRILTAEWGVSVSPGKVTVSTVGITPGVIDFLRDSDCNLTLSLYSPFSGQRGTIVPAERLFPAREIIEIMKNFGLKGKRRMSVAYVMFGGVNDTDEHLVELIHMFKGSHIRVNLVPFHKIPSIREAEPYGNDPTGITSSTSERMLYFKHNLVISGISASVRRSRGIDVNAACGLLASGLNRSSRHY